MSKQTQEGRNNKSSTVLHSKRETGMGYATGMGAILTWWVYRRLAAWSHRRRAAAARRSAPSPAAS